MSEEYWTGKISKKFMEYLLSKSILFENRKNRGYNFK